MKTTRFTKACCLLLLLAAAACCCLLLVNLPLKREENSHVKTMLFTKACCLFAILNHVFCSGLSLDCREPAGDLQGELQGLQGSSSIVSYSIH